MELIRELEQHLMPSFNRICVELADEVPEAKPEVMVSAGGGDSWYVLSLTCFPRENDFLNKVALQVDACSLEGVQTLQALVWWCHTSDYECELFPEPVAASDEAIRTIGNSLPELLTFLKEAARRGYPKAQNKILLNEGI